MKTIGSIQTDIAKVRARMQNAPGTRRHRPTTAETRQELDRLLAEIESRELADVKWWATPWAERCAP
jgi:hypothetical protein